MNKVDVQFFKTKIGDLIVGAFGQQLCLLDFQYRKMRSTVDNRIKKALHADFVENDNKTIKIAKYQLDEYLAGDRKTFDLPLLMVGTEFQKSVWKSLMKVPYGTTSTYLKLAKNISDENAVRAVASANGANAIAIVIPCHRIIGSDGQLVGYGGGLSVKKRLLRLELEKSNHNNNMEPTQESFAFSVT